MSEKVDASISSRIIDSDVKSDREPLICPACSVDLTPVSVWRHGGVECTGCSSKYYIKDGIPRFTPSDGYAGNFSFEWLHHNKTQLDTKESRESEETFRAKTGFSPESIKGKRVLDAGCGMGRFAEVATRWGADVVCVDLSSAVDSAWANLKSRGNVQVYQANLFNLPFKGERFDFIYSIGVLHHTPDCERAFRGLVKYLAPGGTIVIWLYAQDGAMWQKITDTYRRVTVNIPPKILHALSFLAVPYYYLAKIPIVGKLFWTLFPISMHPKPSWRVLDTFDWYSPKYQSKHTYPEVSHWFESEGLVDIRVLDVPVTVSGSKPVKE